MTIDSIKAALDGSLNEPLTAVDRLRLLAAGEVGVADFQQEHAEWVENALEAQQKRIVELENLVEAIEQRASEAERRASIPTDDKAEFMTWIRVWAKSRFGKWITYNTAKGAYRDFDAFRRGEKAGEAE